MGRALGVAFALLVASAPLAQAADPFLRRTATVDAVEKVGPSVVNITTERIIERRNPFSSSMRGDPFFNRFFQDFFEPRAPQTSQNLGSGVLIDGQGHILTNEHVIARANRILITLGDGREFEANVIGADPNNDIAVLKVESDEKLPWTKPGRSSDLMVGEPVIAIGNPFGLSHSVTTGVLSAVDRSIRSENRTFHGFIQTDASINPGNSGGPLLNAEGTLVGINTAIYQGAEGIGFAIPIDVAKRVVDELIEHGEVSPVWFGIGVQDVDLNLREVLDVPKHVAGALVSSIHKGGPADVAGIRRGDIVTRFNRQNVRSSQAMFEIFQQLIVKQTVEVELWRDGKTKTVKARAGALPAGIVDELTQQLLGLQLKLDTNGAYVVSGIRAQSGAEQIGIKKGDYVLAISGRALADADSLREVMLALRGRDRALVVVQRGNGRYHVTIPLV